MSRYNMMESIGAGGMGIVYRALDRLTGETVALKRVERAHGVAISATVDERFLQYLAHEFSVLAGLRHPNIITVLDYGFEGKDRPYFTMELLSDAKTIVHKAQAASHTVRLDLLAQLLQALAYLHHRRILHRDLKPANILVAKDTVRVLDFGLAAPGDSSPEFAGTVAYAAPETLREQHYFAQSDLYAVGVLAVEMFTGHLPFPVGDVLAVLKQQPDLSGLVDENLHAIVTRLLAKEPQARFARAEDVIQALATTGQIEVAKQPAIRESYLQAAPFIGRHDELEQLSGALADALAGQGQAILIGGESGVGKSRLLDELRIQALTAGARVYMGQATQRSGRPYQILQAPLSHLVIDSDATQLTDIETSAIGEVVPDITRLVGRTVSPSAPLAGKAGAQRLAYTIINLIQRQKQPVMLLLEDLHLANESLPVLNTISRVAPGLPLLVLASYRTDEAPQLDSQLPEMKLLSLERFSKPQVQQLCAAMIGPAGEKEDLVKRLHQESDGNVFFLIEILRALADQTGGLARVRTSELPAVLFPEGISQIVQKRLSLVPTWAQPMLNLAAIAGRQIDPILLSKATAHTENAINITDWLYTCTAIAVLEVLNNQWRFAHDKLREALLLTIPPAEKANASRQLALAIESLYHDDEGQARRLADHWVEAGEIDRALYYTVIAGEYLGRIGAFAELRELTARGLKLLRPEDDDALRAQLWNLFGDACRYSDLEAAQGAYQRVLELCEPHNWETTAANARRGLAVIYRDIGETERADQLIDQALEHAHRAADSVALVPALMLKARSVLLRGDYQAAEAYYQQSLAIAREKAREIQIATILMNLGAVACMRGHLDEGQRNFHESEQVAGAIGAIDIVVYCLLNQANIASDRADFATAEAYFERCTPMIEALGEFSLLAGAYYDQGDLALRQGKLAEAEKWYQKSRDVAERLQNYRSLTDCLHGLGKVAYARRDFMAAHRYTRDSQRYAEEMHLVPQQIQNLGYLTRINLNIGQPQAARECLTQGLELAQQVDSNPLRLEILAAALELMIFQEEAHRSAKLLGLVRYHPETQPSSYAVLEEYYHQLETELEADDLAAAIATGLALDLASTIDALLEEIALNKK
ncbi:MAG: protein kinase [Chloroflexi bacterium]|nr:protein kinase [Chloroflexota bacterium]